MRGVSILAAAVLLSAAVTSPVNAQTVTSVEPTILGQSTARPTQRMTLTGPFGPRNITDGLAFSVTDDVYGRPSRTYEFDTASNGITTPGAIAVVPPTADIYDAFTHLATVINSDANAPFTARYNIDNVDVGVQNGWFVLVWKYDREYRRTAAPFGPTATELADPGGDITLNGTFSTNNADNGPVYMQLRGTGLTALVEASSVKLRHQVNTTQLYNGTIILKHANAATVSFSSLNVGTINPAGSPPTFPSLGVYNVEINGTPSGHTVTLVRNLLDDPTFRVHASGVSLGLQWFGENILPGTHWMSSPLTGSDIRENGTANRQICPRLYPFPTGTSKQVSSAVDNENMSLQWSTAAGVRRGWQTLYVNFEADTTLTLRGLWAATGDHYAMSYGAQLRAGDENSTVIAETPPGQRVITPFNWTEFSVSGVFPAGTTKVTFVFYGESPSTSEKSLHLDDLLLYVDNEHPAPPAITGTTTPNYASIGDTSATVTLTGANLTNGQTSVTLRQPDVLPADYLSWADVGRKLVWSSNGGQVSAPFAAYAFTAGDKFVLTTGATAILGEYDIAGKDDDRVITLAQDINGGVGDEGATITGYIIKAPLAATSVNATGTQVTATFDLTGVPAGYRNIIVQVGTHDPIVWREGFNVINPGSELINASFELPNEPPQSCAGPRVELPFSPASDWNVRFWNGFLDPGNLSPMVSYRDDFWNPQVPLPTCPPPERGAHYASSALYSTRGTGQWYQTLNTTPGTTYTLSGYFGHSGEFGAHGTKITLLLLDGDSAAAPMTGASTVVLSLPAFEDWTFGTVTGTATGNLMTVAWEVECFSPNPGPKAVWIDHLVLEKDICNVPVAADADGDGDVDLDDFGVFQICYTGPGGAIPTAPAYCECFDTDGAGDVPDGHISEDDLVNFANCASGSMVPVNVDCDN